MTDGPYRQTDDVARLERQLGTLDARVTALEVKRRSERRWAWLAALRDNLLSEAGVFLSVTSLGVVGAVAIVVFAARGCSADHEARNQQCERACVAREMHRFNDLSDQYTDCTCIGPRGAFATFEEHYTKWRQTLGSR